MTTRLLSEQVSQARVPGAGQPPGGHPEVILGRGDTQADHPLDGRFSVAALLVIDMAVHMTMAMLFGTVITAAAVRLPGARSLVIAARMQFTALLWAVMQTGSGGP